MNASLQYFYSGLRDSLANPPQPTVKSSTLACALILQLCNLFSNEALQ